jgi:hypothetical protein
MSPVRKLIISASIALCAAAWITSGTFAQTQAGAAAGEPKSQHTAGIVLKPITHPSPSKIGRLKMHWACLKSGGKWKVVSDSADVDANKKTYTETKVWGCEAKSTSSN